MIGFGHIIKEILKECRKGILEIILALISQSGIKLCLFIENKNKRAVTMNMQRYNGKLSST